MEAQLKIEETKNHARSVLRLARTYAAQRGDSEYRLDHSCQPDHPYPVPQCRAVLRGSARLQSDGPGCAARFHTRHGATLLAVDMERTGADGVERHRADHRRAAARPAEPRLPDQDD